MTAFELIVDMAVRGYVVHIAKLRSEAKTDFGVMVTVEHRIHRGTIVDNRLIVPDQSCIADMDGLYADMLRQMELGIHHREIEELKSRKISR